MDENRQQMFLCGTPFPISGPNQVTIFLFPPWPSNQPTRILGRLYQDRFLDLACPYAIFYIRCACQHGADCSTSGLRLHNRLSQGQLYLCSTEVLGHLDCKAHCESCCSNLQIIAQCLDQAIKGISKLSRDIRIRQYQIPMLQLPQATSSINRQGYTGQVSCLGPQNPILPTL